MKSPKTMAQLAKALAISKGIRGVYGSTKILGFGISLDELRTLYAREGFPVQKKNSTVIEDHIANWDLAGRAVQRGNMVYFYIDKTSMEDLDAWEQLSKQTITEDCETVGFRLDSLPGLGGPARDQVA